LFHDAGDPTLTLRHAKWLFSAKAKWLTIVRRRSAECGATLSRFGAPADLRNRRPRCAFLGKQTFSCGAKVSALDDIVDRAIDYTNRIRQVMPSYHGATGEGLRKLRDSLAEKSPGDPALQRLDDYLKGLPGQDSSPRR